jgi:hypothetical protein
MAYRFMAFALVTISLLALSILTTQMLTLKTVSAADDSWFVGDGVKKDMWVRYQIQQLDTVNDQPFVMTLWFKDQDEKGNWIVPATVEYQGRTLQGTLKLAPNMAPLGGGGQVPADMSEFIGGYQNSLQWLDAFATKSKPQSLSAAYWGKIASIGGAPVTPAGKEKVTFGAAKQMCGADSCDANVILWHKSIDNKVWIIDNFPFPVKADTFAEVASGQAPPLFKFELLAIGTGQPPAATGGQIPKPPLQASTATGNYVVKLDWEPADIQANSTVNFGVTFTDKQGFPLQNVNYNFNVTDANGKALANLKDQRSEAGGPEMHQVRINTTGPLSVIVTVNSVNGLSNQQGFIDSANFNTVVVPEFPVGAVITTAVVIGVVLIVMRVKEIGRGSLFDSKHSTTL